MSLSLTKDTGFWITPVELPDGGITCYDEENESWYEEFKREQIMDLVLPKDILGIVLQYMLLTSSDAHRIFAEFKIWCRTNLSYVENALNSIDFQVLQQLNRILNYSTLTENPVLNSINNTWSSSFKIERLPGIKPRLADLQKEIQLINRCIDEILIPNKYQIHGKIEAMSYSEAEGFRYVEVYLFDSHFHIRIDPECVNHPSYHWAQEM